MDLSKMRILLTNKKLLFMGIVTFFLLVMILVISFAEKSIVINLDDNKAEHSFRGKHTVGEILVAQNISLREEDKVEPSLDTNIVDGDEIHIVKAVPVTVTVDSKEYNFLSSEKEEVKILENLNIEIRELDIVEYITEDNEKYIDIIRVEEEFETDNIVLKYKSLEKKNNKLDIGNSKIVQRGSNGTKVIKEKVTYHNGVEHDREVVEEKITKEPINQVKEVGTNNLIASSRGNHKFTKTITVEATAYYVGHTTASGTTPKANRTIAASANYSFGTKMYIPGFKNSSNGGVFVVEDRGGAIKGNKIDIYFNTRSEAVNFGRRTMTAYVLQ
ncbi:DUF348 domain-containing protein [Alkalibaculum sp. M08DMB]|uniref:DUF348 domain-containing protein n=1 Tax=Alkalibaculum sporogenes TaxID=2655001 RepID=A0A6A7K7E5_9FIRM|nr:3D domain-containing protein [Alkalibaculum sporogenes]MPW25282.1 DUF348 domain-containing protein [Alkalibaculum sporogenes]